jgi:hypothetical protein
LSSFSRKRNRLKWYNKNKKEAGLIGRPLPDI